MSEEWGAPVGSPVASRSVAVRWRVAAVGALLVGVVIGFVAGRRSGEAELSVPVVPVDEPVLTVPAVSVVEVTYFAYGKSLAGSVTFVTPDGIEQHDVALPMRNEAGEQGVSFRFPRGVFVSISVQNANGDGSVGCAISVDGVGVARNESSAAFGIASCEATS